MSRFHGAEFSLDHGQSSRSELEEDLDVLLEKVGKFAATPEYFIVKGNRETRTSYGLHETRIALGDSLEEYGRGRDQFETQIVFSLVEGTDEEARAALKALSYSVDPAKVVASGKLEEIASGRHILAITSEVFRSERDGRTVSLPFAGIRLDFPNRNIITARTAIFPHEGEFFSDPFPTQVTSSEYNILKKYILDQNAAAEALYKRRALKKK